MNISGEIPALINLPYGMITTDLRVPMHSDRLLLIRKKINLSIKYTIIVNVQIN